MKFWPSLPQYERTTRVAVRVGRPADQLWWTRRVLALIGQGAKAPKDPVMPMLHFWPVLGQRLPGRISGCDGRGSSQGGRRRRVSGRKEGRCPGLPGSDRSSRAGHAAPFSGAVDLPQSPVRAARRHPLTSFSETPESHAASERGPRPTARGSWSSAQTHCGKTTGVQADRKVISPTSMY